jgi:hypothetical protein
MNSNLAILTIVFFGASSYGQAQSSGSGVYSVKPGPSPCKRDDKIPDMQTWFAKTPAAFGGQFEISRSRRSKLIEAYKKLKIGMSKSEVQALLGSPDFEQVPSTYGATIGDKPISHPRCWTEWEYYFEKIGEDFGNPKDVSFHLAFSAEEKLNWAKPQNLNELKEKGSPE